MRGKLFEDDTFSRVSKRVESVQGPEERGVFDRFSLVLTRFLRFCVIEYPLRFSIQMLCNPAGWFKHGNHPKRGGFRRFHVFVVAGMVLGDLRAWGDRSGDHAGQGSDVLRALVRSRNSPGVQEGAFAHSGHQGKRGPQVGVGTQQHRLEPPAKPAARGVSSFAVSHGGQDDGEVDQEEILTGKGSGRDGPRETMPIESKEGIPYGDLGGIPVFTRHEFPEEGEVGGQSKGKGGFPGQVHQHDQGLWHGDLGQPPRGEDNPGVKGQEGKGSHPFPPSPPRAKKAYLECGPTGITA